MPSAEDGTVWAELLLLRHAPTRWNDEQRRQGWADQPLTAAGREEVAGWAARLTTSFERIYCSDLRRARDTAEIIARTLGADDVEPLVALREQDQGAWTGLTKDEIKYRWPEEMKRRPRTPVGGETTAMVLERVLPALTRIAGANSGRRVLAVTHSGVIRTLERAVVAAAPPVPHLEGRWVRVRVERERRPIGLGALGAGELTAGRRRAHGAAELPPAGAR